MTGILKSGALASVYYHGGPLPSPQFVWEINGSAGQLVMQAEQGYANMSELTLVGARQGESRQRLTIPSQYRPAARDVAQPAVNVASLYRQFALDLTTGSTDTPDFAVALDLHRLLDAIERADSQGVRQNARAMSDR